MNTRNPITTATTNANSANNASFGAQPFAGLSIAGGALALSPTADSASQTIDKTADKASQAAPLPKIKRAARRTIVMPRRHVVSLFANHTNENSVPAVEEASAASGNETRAETQADAQAPKTATTGPAVSIEQAPEAPVLSVWEKLEQHMKRGTTVSGEVIHVVHSRAQNQTNSQPGIVGVNVTVEGVKAFAPYRLLGMSPLDIEQSVTLTKSFRVVEMVKGENGAHDRIILNHVMVLNEQKSAAFLKSIKVGSVVSGTIRNIKPFGAFFDVNGTSILVFVKDLPGGTVQSVLVGQTIEAMVTHIDRAQNQVRASVKQLFLSRLSVGAEFTGPVKNVENFGAFVSIEGIVDGLVHVSKFGKRQPARGDTATVKVLEIDRQKGQLKLGLVQLTAR